jgi:hypothetical protein
VTGFSLFLDDSNFWQEKWAFTRVFAQAEKWFES